jgi:hypothetical protein
MTPKLEIPARFYGPADLTAAAVQVLANPAEAGSGTKRVLDLVHFANHTNNTVLVTLYLNGTADLNQIVPGMVCPGSGVLDIGGLILEPGDTLHAKAASADRVTLSVFGRDIQP